MLNAIGGYFGLEGGGDYRPEGALRFATARGALSALLAEISAKEAAGGRIYLPFFLCPEVDILIRSMGISMTIENYHLDDGLGPVLLDSIRENDLFYFYNVFGLSRTLLQLPPSNVIVDNVHAFYCRPDPEAHVVYSLRKFFGVPDGALLYTSRALVEPPPSISLERFSHLVLRADEGAQAGYGAYQEAERLLSANPGGGMSRTANYLMANIDIARAANRRRRNFEFLHQCFGSSNELNSLIDVALSDVAFVPFTYPLFRSSAAKFKADLAREGIFAPTLWAALAADERLNRFERRLTSDVLHLPIDQRYDASDIERLASAVERIRS